MEVRAADCMSLVLPDTLGVQPMNNDEYAAFFTTNIPLFKTFNLTVHDSIVDESARKVVMHLSSVGTTIAGDYSNQYMVTLHMTEDGRKVEKFEEFVDSKYTSDFWVKLRDATSQSSKPNI